LASMTPSSSRRLDVTTKPPAVHRAAPRLARPIPQDQASSEPPVVRVSIGRIEVRVAQTPATPATPPQPGLSLEAYLRRTPSDAR